MKRLNFVSRAFIVAAVSKVAATYRKADASPQKEAEDRLARLMEFASAKPPFSPEIFDAQP